MKNLNPVLLVTFVILLVLNFYFISEAGLVEIRWMRIVSSITFFIIFLTGSTIREKFFSMAFALLVVSDLLILEFENLTIRKLYFFCMVMVYIGLIFHIKKYLKTLKSNNFQKIILVAGLSIYIVMLFMVVDMASNKLGDLVQSALFFLYGAALLALMIFAFAFNHRFSNKVSFYFICAALGFVFTDISRFIAYFVGVEEFYYPDRLFYLIGLASMVKFASLKKTGLLRNEKEWV